MRSCKRARPRKYHVLCERRFLSSFLLLLLFFLCIMCSMYAMCCVCACEWCNGIYLKTKKSQQLAHYLNYINFKERTFRSHTHTQGKESKSRELNHTNFIQQKLGKKTRREREREKEDHASNRQRYQARFQGCAHPTQA